MATNNDIPCIFLPAQTKYTCIIYIYIYILSKHARSNSKAFWLQPVMAIMASMQPESGQIILYARSNIPHPIGSVLAKKALVILCKISPDPIRKARSGFGQTHLVWKQSSVQESFSPVLAEYDWHTTTVPVFHF